MNRKTLKAIAKTRRTVNRFKYPMGASFGLIAVFFVFQNGTCQDTSSVRYSGTSSTGLSTSTSTSATLSLIASSSSVAVGGTITFTAYGGSAPYYFSKTSGSGDGTFADSNQGIFKATTAGSLIVGVRDFAGSVQYYPVTVTSSSSPLSVSPAALVVGVKGTVQMNASGGTTPYQYRMVSGTGSVNKDTGVYTASTNATTAVIAVTDAISNTAQTQISVTLKDPNVPSTQLAQPQFSVCLDHELVFTYQNDGTSNHPSFTFLGTGSDANGIGTNCSVATSIKKVTLTNLDLSANVQKSYRGRISVSGRGGDNKNKSTFNYCISPSDASIAYISKYSDRDVTFKTRSYSNGPIMFNGADAKIGDIVLDDQGDCTHHGGLFGWGGCDRHYGDGSGTYLVNMTGYYSSIYDDCSDFDQKNVVQVLPQ
jgi:hypothetical protein